MGAFLTFALDEGGALVHVDDVAKGTKCGCHCPHCNAPLYAKNAGQIREHTCLFSVSWPDFCPTPRKSNENKRRRPT